MPEGGGEDTTWESKAGEGGGGGRNRFPALERLDLAGCARVGDTELAQLPLLGKLVWLSLAGCGEVTDLGVSHLAALSGLTYLDLTACCKVLPAPILLPPPPGLTPPGRHTLAPPRPTAVPPMRTQYATAGKQALSLKREA